MKYNTEILINLPREKVLELFLNIDHLKQWQPGLLSYAHLDGEPGEEASRSQQVFEGRKGELVITETITSKQLPERIHMSYRSRGVYNEVKNRFTEQEAGITLWQIENDFRFRGIMMLMIPFMKNAFIHNTMLNMDRFKLFAEFGENK